MSFKEAEKTESKYIFVRFFYMNLLNAGAFYSLEFIL
jgi:hypothetical protein